MTTLLYLAVIGVVLFVGYKLVTRKKAKKASSGSGSGSGSGGSAGGGGGKDPRPPTQAQ